MTIQIRREKKRVEIPIEDLPNTNTVVVRDAVLLKAQQANPEWSVDADGEVSAWLAQRTRAVIAYVPMMKLEVVNE